MLLQLPLLCRAASPTLSPRRRPLPRRLRPIQSLRDPWRKLADIGAGDVQERLASWLLKAQTAIADAAAPLVKPIQEVRNPILDRRLDTAAAQEELFMIPETTVNRRTAGGYLSLAAVVSIEQFGRMNGLTGRQMQKIFAAIGTESTRGDARSLVEYCFFRYLSRDSSDFHPSLKVQSAEPEQAACTRCRQGRATQRMSGAGQGSASRGGGALIRAAQSEQKQQYEEGEVRVRAPRL